MPMLFPLESMTSTKAGLRAIYLVFLIDSLSKGEPTLSWKIIISFWLPWGAKPAEETLPGMSKYLHEACSRSTHGLPGPRTCPFSFHLVWEGGNFAISGACCRKNISTVLTSPFFFVQIWLGNIYCLIGCCEPEMGTWVSDLDMSCNNANFSVTQWLVRIPSTSYILPPSLPKERSLSHPVGE